MKKPNQLFSGETINLIKMAIDKWYDIAYNGAVDSKCELCKNFIEMFSEGCHGCPIWELTGCDCTELPGYSNWRKYLIEHGKPYGSYMVFDEQSLLNAEAELEFIKKIFRKALLFWDINGDYKEAKWE